MGTPIDWVLLVGFAPTRDALLEAIDSMESVSLLDKCNISKVKPRLPYHVAFSIDTIHGTKKIVLTVIDEGTSTCVMSISCWKDMGSPELVTSNTLLTSFEGRSFHTHGILPYF